MPILLNFSMPPATPPRLIAQQMMKNSSVMPMLSQGFVIMAPKLELSGMPPKMPIRLMMT